MKKFLTLLLVSIVPTVCAYANNHEGFQGPSCTMKNTTILEALKMNDDTMVTIKGNITKKLSDDKYQFKDATGTMVVEIEHDKWNGISANTKDLLELSGEIDKDFNSTTLDVDYVRKASK